MQPQPLGLIDNWLRHIRDVHLWNREELAAIADPNARADRLCELNVEAQVANVCHTTIVQDAWSRGQHLTVHGCDVHVAVDEGCTRQAMRSGPFT
jgi:carbonic anhydrase